jgi:hypothetical protein
MFTRVLTALIVGYGLTILYSIMLSKILMLFGTTKVNATVTAQLLSFLIYASIAMWIFSVKSLKKIWIYIACSILISVALIYVINLRLA